MTDSRRETNSDAHLPLSGVTVLDLTLARAGPTCVRHLGDWGADIIRIEPPTSTEDEVGRRDGFDFQNLHRNKRTMRLNLKTPESHAAFMRLVEGADVVIENMRSEVKHRLGVSYDDVRKVNPRIVYGSISGFGQTGPYSTRSGYDFLMQAMSGLMSVTGEPDGPPMRVGVPIADILAGKDAVIGILLALRHRDQTGQGQCIDISLFESQVAAMANTFTAWFNGRFEMPRTANDHPSASPYGVYRTSDGYLLIATFNNREFARLATAVGRPDWMENPDYNSMGARVAHRSELASALTEILVQNTRQYWINLLNPAGVSCGPINRMADLERDPHFIARGIEVKLPHALSGEIAVAASPIRCSESAAEYRLGPPVIGQHTAEVLHEVLGMDESAVRQLAEKGVL